MFYQEVFSNFSKNFLTLKYLENKMNHLYPNSFFLEKP